MPTLHTSLADHAAAARANNPHPAAVFPVREYRQYLALQMRPMIRALMVAAALCYGLGIAASSLLHTTRQLPLWLRLAPLVPLLLIAIATHRARRPWLLSSLALGCILLLEIGINLNGVGYIQGSSRVIPGLLLPVVCSMVWLARWDFVLAMALCAMGPMPLLMTESSNGVQLIQYTAYMAIAVAMATLLRAFMARTLREQFRLEQQLREQAYIDGLTGLLLRNRFLELTQQAMNEASEQQQPLCLAFLDVDHFKPLNDNHGHAAGDAVLVGLSAALSRQMRRNDLIGRIGGEEFVVLMPGMDLQQAIARSEQLRLAAHAVPRPEGHLTISIGLAQYLPGQDHIAGLMARADQAMRHAKKGGRDRVVTAAGN